MPEELVGNDIFPYENCSLQYRNNCIHSRLSRHPRTLQVWKTDAVARIVVMLIIVKLLRNQIEVTDLWRKQGQNSLAGMYSTLWLEVELRSKRVRWPARPRVKQSVDARHRLPG